MSATQNHSPEEYDLVILGSGTGGTVAAWTFAAQGQTADFAPSVMIESAVRSEGSRHLQR